MLSAPLPHKLSKLPERILFLSCYDPYGIFTVPEIIAAFQDQSIFTCTSLNMYEHRWDHNGLAIHPLVDLTAFDVLIVHNSLAYFPGNLASLDRELLLKLSQFDGVKILFKQDENHQPQHTAALIAEHRYDIVLTCCPEDALHLVYPRSVVGENVFFERMLTGYVTPRMRQRWRNRLAGRSIDIGYRGSVQDLSFGRLCYEKRQIGDEVSRRLAGKNLMLDISSRWEDRFHGDAWFDFLGKCKATLGVESGASIFDIDGTLDARVAAVTEELGPFRPDPEYAEHFLQQLSDLEGKIYYNQVSPRHFEAAAMGTLQVMYPGEYSSIFVPDRHFVALQRDFSNLDPIVEKVLDPSFRGEMTECAYEEILLNEKYWIETFIKRVDMLISQALEKKNAWRPRLKQYPAGGKSNVLVVAPHTFHLDPRLLWITEAGVEDFNYYMLGLRVENITPSPLAGNPHFLGDAPYLTHPSASFTDSPSSLLTRLAPLVSNHAAGDAALGVLFELERLSMLPDPEFCEQTGAALGSNRTAIFRSIVRYILRASCSLLAFMLKLRGVHIIVAADLPALPAALLYGALFSAKVIYDAHEFWPENDAESTAFEIAYWTRLERKLAPHADYRQTVSTDLAAFMERCYGCSFAAVPNCIPRVQGEVARQAGHDDLDFCRFLFQGNFAIGRGLDKLITAWAQVDTRAVLLLRGPLNAYRDQLIALAKSLGLYDVTVFFPDPVSETELVAAAAQADVGIVPYEPINTGHRYCCPNKLSQYMAAGLPVLANKTEYVSRIISDAGCGLCINFEQTDALMNAVNSLTHDAALRDTYSAASKAYFENIFHWEQASAPLYAAMRDFAKEARGGILSMTPDVSLGIYSIEYLKDMKIQARSFRARYECFRSSPAGKKILPVLKRVPGLKKLWHVFYKKDF
ncbi:MAG: glycosyltransferase [Desulfovibrionaceae bacterium]|nr:glycosyltransferase [Desulfovibrionaceae bacterium]